MSTTSIPNPAAKPAPSSASPFPPDLSHSPLLGILGVLLGAAIVTSAGRLLTLGLTPELWVLAVGFATRGFPYLSGAGRLVVKGLHHARGGCRNDG